MGKILNSADLFYTVEGDGLFLYQVLFLTQFKSTEQRSFWYDIELLQEVTSVLCALIPHKLNLRIKTKQLFSMYNWQTEAWLNWASSSLDSYITFLPLKASKFDTFGK